MISNKQSKLLISLQKKKIRDKLSSYIVEGDKIVKEYLGSSEEVMMLVAKPEWIRGLPDQLLKKAEIIVEASYEELRKTGSLRTPHNALAMVRKKEYSLKADDLKEKLSLALDFVQDPGNLGTIVRLAGWFGVENIICSHNCVDIYNPKVIQSTMGALLSTRVYYTDLDEFLGRANKLGIHVYGSLLSGVSVYESDLSQSGIILLGNESRGIADTLKKHINTEIHIPGAGSRPGIESLNVATAAGIICSEFRRRFI